MKQPEGAARIVGVAYAEETFRRNRFPEGKELSDQGLGKLIGQKDQRRQWEEDQVLVDMTAAKCVPPPGEVGASVIRVYFKCSVKNRQTSGAI